mmetsp:Transcript_8785/g.18185  ORF Transcript_8785/g.18185 Transcript_8785/m.18185 type:complete len:131 (-) Transcript_8785:74-466(-)
MAGTNDLGMGYESETVIENVKRLHQMCHEHGVPTVVLSLPPNVACERSSNYKQKWLRVNEALREWSSGVGACESVALFVDTSALVPLDEEGHVYGCDRLHLSIDGAERFGSELAPLLAPLLSVGVGATSS